MESYYYNANVFPDMWVGQTRYPASITDGTSQTTFFTETYSECVGWWPNWGPSYAEIGYQPTGPAALFQVQPPPTTALCRTGQIALTVPASSHTGGINVGMGDGSVRFVAQGVSPNTWWFALTPAGYDILGPDW